MTNMQKMVKYFAIALAVFLIVGIFSGIVGVISAISVLFSKDSDLVGEMKTHGLSELESVKNLEITVGAAALEIKTGEAFSLESNHKYLKAEVKNGTLFLDEDIPFRVKNASGVKVILTVPAEFSFKCAELETGAGKLTVEDLCTEKLEMELGAGETVFENLTVTDEANVQTGVGNFSVLGGSIAELELQMGVGSVSLTAALIDDCEIECGIGNTEINLIGEKEDYGISVKKGIGSAKVEGKSVSGDEKIGNGSVHVQINGGMGDIQIQFIPPESVSSK